MSGCSLLKAFPRSFSCALLLVSIALSGLSLHAASPADPLKIPGFGKEAVPIGGAWQFHTGDNPAWSAPGLDDTTGNDGWEQITADQPWGAQTHFSYTGYAWYRKRIDITTAPGAPEQLSLMIPVVDDAAEVYWNGQRVGSMGSLSPRLVIFNFVQAPIFTLGPVRSGVLAVRVFKFPLSSNDDGTAGGFESTPVIGSPTAVAALRTSLDYDWLRSKQFYFAMVSLYALVALLSFLAWMRDRSQTLLLWMAIYTVCPLLELFTGNQLRLHIDWNLLQCFNQGVISSREAMQLFLLLWLLQLNDNRRLVSAIRWIAVICVPAGFLDGSLGLLYPGLINAHQFEIADAFFTAFVLILEPIPAVLGIMALVRGRRLEFSRWLVATAAIVNALYYSSFNVSAQGMRFTHWTFPTAIQNAHITVMGIGLDIRTLLRLTLFFCVLYAVIRYALDELRRRSALESEFRNARELQRVLVPETQPEIPGFTLTSAYIPAREVGGDFYQILPLSGGSTLIVLGDVSGKGLRAAMAVSLIVGAIRTLAESAQSPASLLSELNKQLVGRLQGGFATCIALRLDGNGTCTIASAGHPAPLIDGREINLYGSLPLGISPDASYDEQSFSLAGVSHLALYTDGLLEARNSSGELYGFARLAELFRAKPTASQAAEAAVAFGQDDDITVLTLTHEGVAATKAGWKTEPELSPSLA
jgi:Stage II sporulation protein E (SpoIIE)